MNCGALGTRSFAHEVADFVLLPLVVKVGAFACTSKSHGAREARFPVTMSHPGAAVQQKTWRVSVLGLLHGKKSSVASGGLAGNARQRARYGAGGGVSSYVRCPVYVLGSTHGPSPAKSQTSTK